MKLSHNPV